MSFKESCGDFGELIDITIKCFNKFYVDVCKVFFEELAKVTIESIKKDVKSVIRCLLKYSSFFFLLPLILIPIQLCYPNAATEFWLTFYYRVIDHMYLEDLSFK